MDLKVLDQASLLNKAFTWDEEKFFVDAKIVIKQEEQTGNQFKLLSIVRIPEPFKTKKIKSSQNVNEQKEEVKEKIKEPKAKPVQNKQIPPKVEKVALKQNEKLKVDLSENNSDKNAKIKEKIVVLAEPVKIQKTDIPIPKGIEKDEIIDPDVQRNLFSLLYCIKRYEELEPLFTKEWKENKFASKTLSTMFYLFESQKTQIIKNLIEIILFKR